MEFKLKEKYLLLWFHEGVVVHGTAPKSYSEILRIAKIYYESYVEAAQRLHEDSDYVEFVESEEATVERMEEMLWEYFKYTVPETTNCVFLNLNQAINFISMDDIDTNIIFFYVSDKLRMNIINILYTWSMDEIPLKNGTKFLSNQNLDFMAMGPREIDIAIDIFDEFKGSKFIYRDRKTRNEVLDIFGESRLLPWHKSPAEIEIEESIPPNGILEALRMIYCI